MTAQFTTTINSDFLTNKEQYQLAVELSGLVYVPRIGKPFLRANGTDPGLSISKNMYSWFSTQAGANYKFSVNSHYNTLRRKNFTPVLDAVRRKVETETFQKYNSCLVNLYPNGSAILGKHSDADPWLGDDFSVASISIGAKRTMRFTKHNRNKDASSLPGSAKKIDVEMDSGSLIMMDGGAAFQKSYEHAVIARKPEMNVRFNLTFRNVVPENMIAQFQAYGCTSSPLVRELDRRLRMPGSVRFISTNPLQMIIGSQYKEMLENSREIKETKGLLDLVISEMKPQATKAGRRAFCTVDRIRQDENNYVQHNLSRRIKNSTSKQQIQLLKLAHRPRTKRKSSTQKSAKNKYRKSDRQN
jgi:alkylated DNA repair dioxygenase AlkB